MAGALAEFSRRPPGTRAAIYAGVAAALGLLYWQFGLSPVRSAVKDAEEARDSANGQARELAKQKKERDELVATQEELKSQIEQNQKALPTDAEMPAFFDMLARKFTQAGVQVNRREVKREISVENFVKAPVDVEIVGSYYQINQFFASLRPHTDAAAGKQGVGAGEKDRIVTIEDVTVSNPRVVNNRLLLTAKFTASTFRAIAPPPPPTPAPAPAPAPGAAPATGAAPTTGGPDPATSKGPLTPASAKRAVEDSNAAAEQRVREAGQEPPPAGSGVDRLKGGQ
ncbi:MAG: type 4a pilus biogenesis protein PilO [Myxococcales bacterium]|nr:type 4a pilus biogenesis protein PilO [Myxococcales bacterium]